MLVPRQICLFQNKNGRINNGAEFAYRWIKAKARGLVYQLVCFRFLTGGQITLVKTDARSHTLTFKNARWFSRFHRRSLALGLREAVFDRQNNLSSRKHVLICGNLRVHLTFVGFHFTCRL